MKRVYICICICVYICIRIHDIYAGAEEVTESVKQKVCSRTRGGAAEERERERK